MNKMAIFVEGQTEQQFTQQLLEAIAGAGRVQVDLVKGYGGAKRPRIFTEVHVTRLDPKKEYYVLIYDSATDSRVLSDVIDQYSSLVSKGFQEILAIRDVFPQHDSNIPTIRADFLSLAPSTSIKPLLCLAIMEIEAWFIGEHTHFAKLHPSLTTASVNAALGYDPAVYDIQLVANPAEDLRRAYNLVHIGYNKSQRHLQRTLSVLDYASIYLNLTTRFPDIDTLIRSIDSFLS